MFTISYAHLNMIHCGGKYLRKWVPYHFGWIKWSLGFKLGSLHDYSLTPGSSFIKPSSNQPKAATVKLAQKPPDIEEIDDKGNDDDESLDVAEEDCVHLDNFNLVWRRLKALYNNGWFTGDILHFNTFLHQYKIQFDDGSTDYIQPRDINNIEIMILTVTNRTRKDLQFCLFCFFI